MTIVESRLKVGTLVLGADPDALPTPIEGVSFACQATNVHVTPSYDDDGDNIETLCGDTMPPGKKEKWVIAGTSVQDFDDPEGFLTYCYTNAMTTVAFEWTPNANGLSWSGKCVVVALEEGGDVNSRLTTDWEFEISGGRPVRTYAAP